MSNKKTRPRRVLDVAKDWNPRPCVDRGSVSMPIGAHPHSFGLLVTGDCLKPLACDGDVLIVEPALPKPGEIAAVWFRGQDKPVCKILTSEIRGFPHNAESECVHFLQAKQINPEFHYRAPMDAVEQIARVHSVLKPERQFQSGPGERSC